MKGLKKIMAQSQSFYNSLINNLGSRQTFTGPGRHKAVFSKSIKLSNNEIEQAKQKKFKIAILLHTNSDFSEYLMNGMKNLFYKTGSQITLFENAEFNSKKQTEGIQKAISLDVDAIIILVIDAFASYELLKLAAEKKIKIVLISNIPIDFRYKKDYASVVTSDLLSVGNFIAEMINQKLNGKCNLAFLYHSANFYVTNRRDELVRTILRKKCPKVKVIVTEGIINPNESKEITISILSRYPEIQAIYAPWDTIAEGVIDACQVAGRKDIKIFTIDAGKKVIEDMQTGGNISGLVTDTPFNLGSTVGKVAVLNLLGKITPPFIVVPVMKIIE